MNYREIIQKRIDQLYKIKFHKHEKELFEDIINHRLQSFDYEWIEKYENKLNNRDKIDDWEEFNKYCKAKNMLVDIISDLEEIGNDVERNRKNAERKARYRSRAGKTLDEWDEEDNQ